MQVSPAVYQLTHRGVNIILIAEDELTLIDTGFSGSLGRIRAFIRRLGRSLDELGLVIITHNHLDHSGGLPELLAAKPVRVAAHRADLSEGEEGLPYHGFVRKMLNVPPVPFIRPLVYPHPDDIDLKLEGGEVLPPLGGLKVIHTPGHTPGSICLYSARDKLLFVGDTVNNRLPRLRLPPNNVSSDISQLKTSLGRLAGLDFETLCFGHGRPITSGAGDRLRHFLAGRGAAGGS